MKNTRTLLAGAALLLGATLAHADITIGVSLSLTGPTSALGIPSKNGIELWPKTIAGEKLNVIMLDDATDPTNGVKNARRFVTEDKVDVIVGSVDDAGRRGDGRRRRRGPDGAARRCRRSRCRRARTAGSFRMPQSTAVMAIPIVEHWKKTGVKTYGFLGYADAYGESLAEGHHADGREGRHQAGRGRALRALRHQRHRPGAEADRRQPRCDPRRRLGQRRGDAAQAGWSSAATRAARSTRPTARRRWT